MPQTDQETTAPERLPVRIQGWRAATDIASLAEVQSEPVYRVIRESVQPLAILADYDLGEMTTYDLGEMTTLASNELLAASFGTTVLLDAVTPGSRRDMGSTPEGGTRKAPSAEDKLAAELLSYLDLSEGWDGFESVPVPRDAVLDALSFLDLRPGDVALPYPQIAPDGEVGFYWRTEDVFAEIGFYGDGEFSYYAKYTPKGGEFVQTGRDHCSVGDEWPEELLLILYKHTQ